jgi:hypothetical protein
VENQLKDGFNIQASDWGNVVLYEPWAMEPVKLLLQNKHKKCTLEKQFKAYGRTISQKKFHSLRRKCKPENAKEIFLNQM